MQVKRLTRYSGIMATLTQVLIIGMLVLNAVGWLFPIAVAQHGFGFSLTAMSVMGLGVDMMQSPWWQLLGGVFLSSIPLLILARGLNALRALFCAYARGEYFLPESAVLLGKVGQGVALWVLVSFLIEPVMSVWMTMLQPAGERLVTLSFDASRIVALFLAGSVMVIARILGMASEAVDENRQFV